MKPFNKIAAGLRDALAFMRGEKSARVTTIAWSVDRDGRVKTDKHQREVKLAAPRK